MSGKMYFFGEDLCSRELERLSSADALKTIDAFITPTPFFLWRKLRCSLELVNVSWPWEWKGERAFCYSSREHVGKELGDIGGQKGCFASSGAVLVSGQTASFALRERPL